MRRHTIRLGNTLDDLYKIYIPEDQEEEKEQVLELLHFNKISNALIYIQQATPTSLSLSIQKNKLYIAIPEYEDLFEPPSVWRRSFSKDGIRSAYQLLESHILKNPLIFSFFQKLTKLSPCTGKKILI